MRCHSCKEEISEKFKHALSQNTCPFCGRGIFSAVEFHFRRSLSEILVTNGVVGQDRILNIIRDIETILKGPDQEAPTVAVVSHTGSGGASNPSDIEVNGTNSEIPSDVITEKDFEDAPPTSEEEAEVKAMIDSGEVVFSGIMDTSAAKKKPVLNKPVPKPIQRL